jgi:hypothetical protein
MTGLFGKDIKTHNNTLEQIGEAYCRDLRLKIYNFPCNICMFFGIIKAC